MRLAAQIKYEQFVWTFHTHMKRNETKQNVINEMYIVNVSIMERMDKKSKSQMLFDAKIK